MNSRCRTMGLLCLIPLVQRDGVFMSDLLAAVIDALASENLAVRTRASWTLGQSVQSMPPAMTRRSQRVQRHVRMRDWPVGARHLGAPADHAARSPVAHQGQRQGPRQHCSRARPHGPPARRCIRLDRQGTSTTAHLAVLILAQGRGDFQQLLQALVAATSSGAAKVRWNACVGLGHVLGNNALFVASAEWAVRRCFRNWLCIEGPELQAPVFQTLARVITTSPNFKVRINAAVALAVPRLRAQFQPAALLGECVQVDALRFPLPTASLRQALISALGNAEGSTFADLRYVPQLKEQVRSVLLRPRLTRRVAACGALPSLRTVRRQ